MAACVLRRAKCKHIFSRFQQISVTNGNPNVQTRWSLNIRRRCQSASSNTSHFGFESVPEHEKQERVDEVFHRVADKYDLMNDVMSGGIHRLWKDYFMEKLGPSPGMKLIDVAGGTGDIAFRFLKYTYKQEADEKWDYKIPMAESSDSSDSSDGEHERAATHVTICDINQNMLDVGKHRAEAVSHNSSITWLQGNAECLPIEDNQYDAYTIAFGIRNVTHIDRVLSEAYRVLKPGGRFMCLEFSYVKNPVIRKIYDEYSFQVIPVMGQVVAADWKSYQYLVESIRNFPKQKEFASMIRDAGFKAVTYENLLLGVAAIHSGFKL